MLHEIFMMTSPDDEEDKKPNLDIWDAIIIISCMVIAFTVLASVIFS